VEVRFLIVAMIAIPMFSQAPAEPEPAFAVASVKARIPESMALIPGTTTQMGIDEDEVPHFQQIFHINQPRLFQDVIPKHSVTLDSFYIDKKLATNAEFKKFVDRNPNWQKDYIKPSFHNGEYLREWVGNAYPGSKTEHPVVNVVRRSGLLPLAGQTAANGSRVGVSGARQFATAALPVGRRTAR
jgi:formylglycine-generating enzyme required for sulfatase activity